MNDLTIGKEHRCSKPAGRASEADRAGLHQRKRHLAVAIRTATLHINAGVTIWQTCLNKFLAWHNKIVHNIVFECPTWLPTIHHSSQAVCSTSTRLISLTLIVGRKSCNTMFSSGLVCGGIITPLYTCHVHQLRWTLDTNCIDQSWV